MKEKILTPQDQVFWYLKKDPPKRLSHTIKTDVVVIGGGMTGLSVAQSFYEKGRSVVLLEKYYCGSGASGKSSGFITPDSELNLTYFNEKFGPNEAKKLWEFVIGGVNFIEKNINKFGLNCDYQIEDTFIVANSEKQFSKIKSEYQTRQKLSYKSFLYDKQNILNILGSREYYGGVRYSNTFGINGYAYCQEMKKALENLGVQIYEETPVIKIHSKGADTVDAKVEADQIIVCTDKFLPDLQKKLYNDVYHAQTFLMISKPLKDEEVKKIFPENKLMVWDTDLIYQYFRMTAGNRFMIGGSDLISIFWGKERHNYNRIFNQLNKYVKKHFKDVKINFEYFWPGLIGVSKDVMPLAGTYHNQPNIHYIGCAEGLPWAAALGCYSAEKIINNNKEFDKYFSIERKFPINKFTQFILGKRLTFALSNFLILHNI